MRVRRLFIAALLSTALLGALPAYAAAPVPSQPAAPALQPGSDLLTPKPTPRIGILFGPCNVSVTCKDGRVVSCTGQSRCEWRTDISPSYFGYVSCDSVQTRCFWNSY